MFRLKPGFFKLRKKNKSIEPSIGIPSQDGGDLPMGIIPKMVDFHG